MSVFINKGYFLCLSILCFSFNINADILKLQSFSEEETKGNITLLNLNTNINSWYLVTLNDSQKQYHIQNVAPDVLRLYLDESGTLIIKNIQNQVEIKCDLINSFATLNTSKPYNLICNGAVLVRNNVNVDTSTLTWSEYGADVSRDKPFGEEVINVGKWFKSWMDSAEEIESGENRNNQNRTEEELPLPAVVKSENATIQKGSLGIKVNATVLPMGGWLRASSAGIKDYVSVSMIKNSEINFDLIKDPTFDKRINSLSNSELNNTTYLMAFNLNKVRVGYQLGASHPKVGWSIRLDKNTSGTRPAVSWLRNQKNLFPIGPDGVSDTSPFVRLGILPPQHIGNVVGTFVGGYKLDHAAFRQGTFGTAEKNGSHYGFIQDGVVFSPLKEGLMTAIMKINGEFELKTWSSTDTLDEVQHARQNGVPIIEWNEELQKGVPSEFVNQWGAGNWSGDANGSLQTLRSGVCLQQKGDQKFLIFAYFPYSTPSSMARVFQAYQCQSAMLLDMNSSSMCFGAVYARELDGNITPEYLHTSMKSNDETKKTRFLFKNDSRDFFYILKKEE